MFGLGHFTVSTCSLPEPSCRESQFQPGTHGLLDSCAWRPRRSAGTGAGPDELRPPGDGARGCTVDPEVECTIKWVPFGRTGAGRRISAPVIVPCDRSERGPWRLRPQVHHRGYVERAWETLQSWLAFVSAGRGLHLGCACPAEWHARHSPAVWIGCLRVSAYHGPFHAKCGLDEVRYPRE